MLVLTGCGSGDSTDGPPSASSTSSQVPTTPSASASESLIRKRHKKRAVLRTYSRFWEEQVKAYGQGT